MSSLPQRVVLALTSHDLLGDTGQKTGFMLSEAAEPWKVFKDAGYAVDLVSVRGGRPPVIHHDLGDPVQGAFLADPDVAAQIEATSDGSEVNSADYAAIYFVGGHGTMWDFPDAAQLTRIGREIYENGGVVSGVCHGVAALVNLTLSDGSHLVAGKEFSSFTNEEESEVKLADVVPFLLQSALEERGGTHSKAEPFTEHVVVSERLVTGQNPASSAGVAAAVVDLLTG